MTKKCTTANIATIGGLTATIALLMGLPAATADELADLRANQERLRANQELMRANQELIQRRIEQLAQTGGPNIGGQSSLGSPVAAGVVGAGNFPRSFLIPGTDTSIRVGGFIDETIDWYLQNGSPNGNASTTVGINGNLTTQALDIHGQTVPGFPTPGDLVPVNTAHSRGNGVFLQSPQETRLNVETRTPTAWGESRTFIEIDFRGCTNGGCQTLLHVSDNLLPRVRYAYGTLGGFLAGQANSNFRDADAEPEVLILDGPPGEAGINRIPQVRYTMPAPWNSAMSFSAEAPDTEVLTPAGLSETSSVVSAPQANLSNGAAASCPGVIGTGSTTAVAPCTLVGTPAKSTAPDVTYAWYFPQPWGHFDVRLVGRLLDFTDGHLISKQYFGGGGGLSGDVKPGWFGWEKDDFQWQFTAGNGIGRYIFDNTNAGLATNYLASPTTAAAANQVIVKPITGFGAVAGYQHWWTPNLRSNLAYGYAYYGIPSQLVGPLESITANQQLQSASVNLIWNPVAFIDLGVECFWGQRKVVANIYGTEQTMIGKVRVKF